MARPRKPLAQKLAEGARIRRERVAGVDTPMGEVPVSTEMSAEELAIRTQVLAAVAPGQVRPSDAETLNRFCQQLALQRQARRELRAWQAHPEKWKPGESEMLMIGSRGSLAAHPLIKVINDLESTIRHLASELGLSPAARERVSGDDPQLDFGGDGWHEFNSPAGKGGIQ